MKRVNIALLGVCCAVTGAAGSGATSDAWPIFRGDAGLSGVSPARIPATPVLRWTFDAGDKFLASPVIAEGWVFAADVGGTVHALGLADGERVWSRRIDAGIEASPLWHAGRLYVGDLDGQLHALDAQTGETRWTYRAQGRIMGGANVLAGERPLVLFGSYDHRLHAVDAADGAGVWQYETDHYVNGTPAIGGGLALIGGCDEQLHVVRAADGAAVAVIEAGAYLAASPALREGFAAIGHYHGEVLGIDLAAAAVQWRFAPADEGRPPVFYAAPALTATRVLAGARNGRLYALSRRTGEVVWQFAARGDIDGAPVVTGDWVLFGSRDGHLYRLRFSDGQKDWSYRIGSPVLTTPAVVTDWIVVGANDGSLYAFGAAP